MIPDKFEKRFKNYDDGKFIIAKELFFVFNDHYNKMM